jgi:hypothetical protein
MAQFKLKSSRGNSDNLLPKTDRFFNLVLNSEVEDWIADIKEANDYLELINYRHITPNLSIDELKSLTSGDLYDGKLFCR